MSFKECLWTREPQPRDNLQQSPGGKGVRSKGSPGFPGPSELQRLQCQETSPDWVSHRGHIATAGEEGGQDRGMSVSFQARFDCFAP